MPTTREAASLSFLHAISLHASNVYANVDQAQQIGLWKLQLDILLLAINNLWIWRIEWNEPRGEHVMSNDKSTKIIDRIETEEIDNQWTYWNLWEWWEINGNGSQWLFVFQMKANCFGWHHRVHSVGLARHRSHASRVCIECVLPAYTDEESSPVELAEQGSIVYTLVLYFIHTFCLQCA